MALLDDWRLRQWPKQCSDENNLDATADAFALLHVIAETRLKRRKIVVIDATNVRQEDRAQLVRIAKKFHALAVAILLNPGEDICHERNKARPDRQYGPHVVRNHMASLRRNIRRIDKEGFRYVHELRSIEEIDGVEIMRERLWTDVRHKDGPFDIIDAPEHLARLRSRGLGRKRSLAMREFLLGQEALRRFITREPLRRVHEAVFGVLALESEPVDPRL